MTELTGFQFVTTLVVDFDKSENNDATKYTTFSCNSKAETIINETNIGDVISINLYCNYFKHTKISWKVLLWIIVSVVSHVNISKYNPLAGSSYIKLPKKLNHPRKGLINIQKTSDNECFKQCLFRYLYPTDHNPRRIRKVDKLYEDKLDFKDIKLTVKVRDIHKIERKNSIGISVFSYEEK